MSGQNTTIDNIRSAASSTARNIADSIEPPNVAGNPKNGRELKSDGQQPPLQKGDFRDQLDRAALDDVKEVETKESTLQKVMSYVPGTGLSKQPQSTPSKEEGKEDGMLSGVEPRRPDNEYDLQIEEFVREYYKSDSKPKASDGGSKG